MKIKQIIEFLLSKRMFLTSFRLQKNLVLLTTIFFFTILLLNFISTRAFGKNLLEIIAQVPAVAVDSVTKNFVKTEYIIVDNWGRAQVVSPRGKDPIKTVAELKGKIYGFEPENKGGLNNAINLSKGSVRTVYEAMQQQGLTLSYIVGMTIEPNVSGAVEFIQESIDLGMLPIIRLCYDGGCNFNLSANADQIIEFYSAVAKELEGTDYEFIAVLGPNEPGTGNEATGFGVPPVNSGGYNILIQRANEAAEALQEYRFVNGGVMYLAPAIFNITNTQNDDANAYLFGQFGSSINPDLFDYILVNSYNLNNGDADLFFTEAIGGRPSSIRSYAEKNDLKVIFTEFGYFSGSEERLRETYFRLCNDSIVEAINFFRPFPPNAIPGDTFTPRQNPPITMQSLKQIVRSCNETPERPGSRKRWINANFDSCVPQHNYFSISYADNLPESNSITDSTSTRIVDYIIPDGICSIVKDRSRNKIINFGDSLSEESSNGFNDSNIITYAFPGASTRWFVGEKVDITNIFNNLIVKEQASFARIILGTNDIGKSTSFSCNGINDLSESVQNIKTIADAFKQNGIIPIIVTVPARDVPCQSRQNEFNDKIRSSLKRFYPIINADKFYSSSDLRDDRHLKDYTKLNIATKKLINKLNIDCGINRSSNTQNTQSNNDNNNNNVNISQSIVGTRFVNADKSYGLGYHKALSCGKEFENKDTSILNDRSKGPQFLLNCSGGECFISWSGYIMVEAPLKSLGSSNPANSSLTKAYTPVASYISQFVFSNINKSLYDPLNQFAWGLYPENGNEPYPMPWLGSIVNNLSELIKQHGQFSKYLNQETFNPVSFSNIQNSIKETQYEIESNPVLARKIVNQYLKTIYTVNGYVHDEKAVCLVPKNGDLKNFTDANCFDSQNHEIIKTQRPYDFTKVSQNWKNVDVGTCKDFNFRYLDSNDEYIPGPEVKVSQGSMNFSNSEICWRFGNRKIHDDTKNFWSFKYDRSSGRQKILYDFGRNGSNGNPSSCMVKNKATVSRTYPCNTALRLIDAGFADPSNRQQIARSCNPARNIIPNVTIQEYCSSIINRIPANTEESQINCDIKKGNCNFPLDSKDVCFNYRFHPDHETYIKNNSFPQFPTFNIPGINDALYHYYTLINNMLSSKNLRFVYGNISYGWKLKVHSILRDENKSSNDKYISPNVYNSPYLYVGESNTLSCVNDTSKLFDNKAPKAKGKSDIVEYQYFPWLGTLDIMQEILTVYLSNTIYPDVGFAKNSDGTYKLRNGKKFLQSFRNKDGELGLSANILLSRPFLTCDERIACIEEKDLDNPVWCPIKNKKIRQLLNSSENLPCIDTVDSFGKPLSGYKDALGEYLCEQGYIVEGICNQVKLKCEEIKDDSINYVSSTDYEKIYCPIRTEHSCFQGPFGGYTHCKYVRGLPLDLFSKITPNRSQRDVNIYVPESGTITSVNKNAYGTEVQILGEKSGITYVIQHLDYDTVPKVNTRVQAGEKLGEYDKNAYDYNNWHIHVSAYYQGKAVDPYLLYGTILGCNAKPPRPGMKYLDKAEEGMCRYGNTPANQSRGIAWALNDNSCPTRFSKENIADNNLILSRFEVYKKNSVSNSNSSSTINKTNFLSNQQQTKCSMCPLPPKNNVPYPECPKLNYICDDQDLLSKIFANSAGIGISNCDQKIKAIGSAVKTTKITFLGVDFVVNSLIVDALKKVEAEIQKEAISYKGNYYVFPSGPYTFVSGGAFNPRRIHSTEGSKDCLISNHTFGIALDLNVSTNPYTNLCSVKFDMPPEVVKVFERNGFRWGGRYSAKADYMHFEYCVDNGNFKPISNNVTQKYACDISLSSKNTNVSSRQNYTNIDTSTSTNIVDLRQKVLKLCSPEKIGWTNVTIDDVYRAYNKLFNYPRDPSTAPNRTVRIKQILDAAKKQNINPAFLFAVWYTEGGYLGDSIAGGRNRNAYGFDFGCGLSKACGIAFRDGSKPTQEQIDSAFEKSLNCITKQGTGCKLLCSYDAILSNKPVTIPRYGVQQPGLGGFLECYGPVADNNPHFAKNFVRVYDAFSHQILIIHIEEYKGMIVLCIYNILNMLYI
ncbi:MAG: M15 family metallopeptidase [Candidatus Dojkabacteria bacterium]|nr:M15 family metallopeptidase [Candidatus Dojkabacteria bacterium]